LRIEKVYAPVIFLACLLLVLSLSAAAAAGTSEAVSYMRSNQMDDGGFAEPGRGPNGSDSTTAWSVMALRAAGIDPNNMQKNGKSPLDFLAQQSSNWRSVTDYERTLLAVAAAGENVHSFAGVDLAAKVQSYQRSGGNIGDAVNSNAFGMLAYNAAGITVPSGAVQWHRNVQNSDGGWGNNPGGASNPDMTGASIMALRAAGVDAGDPSIQAALGFLHSIQNADGGFSFQPGKSDAAATAWCVQAIVAAGQDPAGAGWSKNGNAPYGFVASMQASDGHFYWMEGSDKNPVWTTAYAVCALARKPFPVGVSYTEPPAEQGGGGGDEQPQNEQPPPSPDETDTGQEEQGGGAEAAEEAAGSEEGFEAAGDEETAKSEADEKPSARAVEENSEAKTGGGGSTGGTSMLWWLLPLLLAVPLLGLGGWYIYRRYAT
jgi:hypothetical protein